MDEQGFIALPTMNNVMVGSANYHHKNGLRNAYWGFFEGKAPKPPVG
jgi:hypothetical protein